MDCDFLFTDFTDDWTFADFARFVYNDDYIKVDGDYAGARAVRTALYMKSVLDGCQHLKILDYGSGSGRFADEMKRFGFPKVLGYDPFSSPERPQGVFDLITCFEVVEHSPDPMRTFSDIEGFLSDKGAIFVGQTFQPDDIERIRGSWWYLGPRNGHVSTYSEYTFINIASKLGLDYYRGIPYVFGRTGLDVATQRAIERIGTPVKRTELFAPSAGLDPRWHGLEMFGSSSFRWTAAGELAWPPKGLNSGLTFIRVPFLMEIAEGFAAKCRIFVDGSEATTRIEGKTIVAEINLARAGRYRIVLRTPSPLTPKSLRNASDDRPLGLAIPVAPTT